MAFAFYILAMIMVIASFMVISTRNPVHAVLWLILTFLSAVVLFILLNAEFLAMLLMVVYVGAVAVLFLFVVMMLDVDFASLRAGALKHLPFGILIAVILAVELIIVARATGGQNIQPSMPMIEGENTYVLGLVMFEQFPIVFLGSGLVLLVAMIGAIVLTLSHRSDVKRQSPVAQMQRDPKESFRMVDAKSGKGV